MLLNTNTDQQITNAQSTQFTVSKSSAIFTLMTDKLYKDKPLAALRETLSNAIDTTDHARSLGFDPTAPKMYIEEEEGRAKVTCVDNGMGMNADQIATVYTTLFDSSKSDDNSQTGGFGIGALAIFAVTDHFEIVTRARTDEKGRKYIVHREADGTPSLTFVGEFNAPFGTRIEFSCDKIPRKTLKTLTLIAYFNGAHFEQTTDGKVYFSTKITKHGTTGAAKLVSITHAESYSGPSPLYINEIALDVFACNSSLDRLSNVHTNYLRDGKTGKILIGSNLIDINRTRGGIIRKMPVGSLSLTPARESFEDTLANAAALDFGTHKPEYLLFDYTTLASLVYDVAPSVERANRSSAIRAIHSTLEKHGKAVYYENNYGINPDCAIYLLPMHARRCDLRPHTSSAQALYLKVKKGYDIRALTADIKSALRAAPMSGFSRDLKPTNFTIDDSHMDLEKPKSTRKASKKVHNFLYEPHKAPCPDTPYFHGNDHSAAKRRIDTLKKLHPKAFGDFNAVKRADSYSSEFYYSRVITGLIGGLSDKDKKDAVKRYAQDLPHLRQIVADNIYPTARFQHSLHALSNTCFNLCGTKEGFKPLLLAEVKKEIKKELAKEQDKMFMGAFRALPAHTTIKINKRALTAMILHNIKAAII